MDEPIRSKLIRLRVPLGRGTWYNSAIDLVQGESITFRVPHAQPGSNGGDDPDPSSDWLTGRIGSGGEKFSITDGFTIQVDWPGTLELQADSNHAIRHTHFTLVVHRNGLVQSASERPVLDCGGTGGVLVPTYRPLLGQISVYAWVKPRSVKPGAVIVSDWAAASNGDYLQRFELGLNDTGCLTVKFDSPNPSATGLAIVPFTKGEQLPLDTWCLVGFNFDGNILTLVNGTSFESIALGVIDASREPGKPDTTYRKLGIGCDPATSEDEKAQRAWDGQIAEVSIWSRALGEYENQEMLRYSLAQGNLDKPLSFWQRDPTLRNYWPLDDGTGEAVDDETLRAPGDTYGQTTWVRENLPLQRIVSKVVLGRGMWQSAGVVLHKMSEKSVLLQPVQGVVGADESVSSTDSDEEPTLDGDNLVPDLPTGALIGRIGDTVFYVSDGFDEYITKIPSDAVGPLSLAFNDSLKNRKDNKRQVGILAIVSPDVEGVFIDSDAVPHNSGGRASFLAQARAHVTRKVSSAQEQAHQTVQDAHARAQDLKQTTTAVSNIKNGLSKFLAFAQSDGTIGLLESAIGFTDADTVNKVQIKPNILPDPVLGLTVDSTQGSIYFWQSPTPSDFHLTESDFAGKVQHVVGNLRVAADPLSIVSVVKPDQNELYALHRVWTAELRPGSSPNSVSLVAAHIPSYDDDSDSWKMFPDIEIQQGADPRTLGPVVDSDAANETWAAWWGGRLYRFFQNDRQDIPVSEMWKPIVSNPINSIGKRTPFSSAPIAMSLDEERKQMYWLFGTGYSLDGYSSTSGLLMGLLVTDSQGAPIADPILYPLGLARWVATESGWTTELSSQKDVHKLPICPLAERGRVGIVESLVVDPLTGWAYTFLRVRNSTATQASTLLLPFRINEPVISRSVKLYDYDITEQYAWYDNTSRDSPDFMGFARSSPYLKFESLNTQKAAQHAGLVQQYQQAVLKKDSSIAAKRQDVQNRLSAKQQEQAKKHDEAQKAHADASALHQKRIDDTKAKLTTTQNTKTAKINAAKEKAASDKANAQAQKDQKVQSERDKAYATHVTPRQNDLDNARKERDKKR